MNKEFKLPPGARLLTNEELDRIQGGESAWYWVAFGVGAVGGFFKALWKYCEENPFSIYSA